MSGARRVRNVTGCLAVARSGEILHTRKGVEGSWLYTPDPTCFLLKASDFLVRQDEHPAGFRKGFLFRALSAPFPEFVLDIPIKKDEQVDLECDITILRVPDQTPWADAVIVGSIKWDDVSRENGGVRVWNWTDETFMRFLRT